MSFKCYTYQMKGIVNVSAMRLLGRMGLLMLASALFFMSTLASGAAAGHHHHHHNSTANTTAAADVDKHEDLHHKHHSAVPAATKPKEETTKEVDLNQVQHPGSHNTNTSSSSSSETGLQHHSSFDPDGIPRKIGPFTAGLWHYAHATFYGDESAEDTMQGACGYQNLWQQGYGAATTALSTTLFNGGFACGTCFEIKCVGSWDCYPGNPSTKVTATNFCPPNWARPTNNGGWCNPPRQHFDMAKPAFEKIAYWRAGIVPVAYRRIPCTKQGNMEFLIEGNQWWHIVFITNVGGPGDIGQVYVRGSRTNRWMQMTHNWGAGYQIFHNFMGESLSFMVVSNSNYETVVSWNMVPSNWQFGRTYFGRQFQISF